MEEEGKGATDARMPWAKSGVQYVLFKLSPLRILKDRGAELNVRVSQ